MASRKSVWRHAQNEYSVHWMFEEGNARGGGKGRWVCKHCGHKVFHGLTSKDPDTALQAHLRMVRRHDAQCTSR